MGFRNDAYCTVWLNKYTNQVIDKYEKYAEVQLSTSKKVNGRLENDFSAKVRFIGEAFNKIKNMELAEKDRLKLLKVETTNKYDKTRKTTYTNFICWDFELADNSDKQTIKQPEIVEEMQPLGEPDDTLPF